MANRRKLKKLKLLKELKEKAKEVVQVVSETLSEVVEKVQAPLEDEKQDSEVDDTLNAEPSVEEVMEVDVPKKEKRAKGAKKPEEV